MTSRNSKRSPDWGSLYDGLCTAYRAAGNDRMLAAMENFRDRKETICRKLGVVSDADVARVAARMRKSKQK